LHLSIKNNCIIKLLLKKGMTIPQNPQYLVKEVRGLLENKYINIINRSYYTKENI